MNRILPGAEEAIRAFRTESRDVKAEAGRSTYPGCLRAGWTLTASTKVGIK